MGIANIINTSTSSGGGGGEIIRELVNSSDGQGLYFSNTGYIHLANNAAVEFGTSDFSIEFVMNQTGEVGSSGGSIYQSATTVNNKFSIENHVSSNVVKLIFFNAVGAAAQYDLSYNMAADYNEPTHYVVSCDRSGNAVLYRNGTEVASVSIAASASTNLGDGVSSTAMIGNSGSGYTFLGGLYRFRTWNKALTHDEVDTCFQRADVPFADQYGSETSKILNGTAWTGASGTTAPNSWTTGNQGTYTIDSSSGSGSEPALKIARSIDNPYIHQNFTAVIGAKYRISYKVKNIDATQANVGIGSSAIGSQYYLLGYSSTNWETVNLEITATTSLISVYLQAITSTGTQAVYFDSVEIKQVGCVTDYDLAFANPTQSLMVQDRAGAADGTASATGVSQTQPIVQLNSTSARIGTTAATPADGEVLANKLKVGDIHGEVTLNNTSGTSGSTVLSQTYNGGVAELRIGSNISTAATSAMNVQGGDAGLVTFNGGIDSAGLVTINKDGLAVKIDGTANTTKGIMLRNTGNQHGYLQTDGSLKLIAEDAGKTMSFYTADDGTGTARMVIDSSGNITQAGGEFVLEDGSGATVGKISTLGGNNLTISGTQSNHCGVSFATQAILPCTQSTVNNNTVDIGANGNAFKDLWLAGEAKLAGFTTLGGFNDLTIAAGAVTATSSTHNIDTEGGGATDYLDTINGGSTGSIITLMAASGSRTVVVEDGTNLKLAGDCTLDNAEDTITLIKSGSAWHEVSRSNNGA